MNLLNRIKRLEQTTGGAYVWMSELLPLWEGEKDIKVNENKIVDDWVQAVLAVGDDEE
ncbi:hypothetical protein [Pseudalkalibacillus decolorationis]|uniref:hypothetical protein n=1 Tax=Pseudalkalibacillus decolorationis TaxID=163879 RepID=UPI00214990B8|nr:hypothetical protein [Pseudalkalibacillus decolorationis]